MLAGRGAPKGRRAVAARPGMKESVYVGVWVVRCLFQPLCHPLGERTGAAIIINGERGEAR